VKTFIICTDVPYYSCRGTPNSGTTSLSALSTTAIKDGHQGHNFPHSRHAHQSSSASASSTSVLDAERADRISRLAGLERVATARTGGAQNPGSTSGGATPPAGPGYFDSYSHMIKERSTVGSASATGSVGGRTTWASGSDAYDPDKMSEDDGVSSVGGLSDEGNASLVGFGEGASSTISGPVSTVSIGRMPSAGGRPQSFGSPGASRGNAVPSYLQPATNSPMAGPPHSSPSPAGSNTPEPFQDVRMVDGMTYDPDVVDTTVRTPRLVSQPGHPTGEGIDVSEQSPRRI
jgi:hypothetical protein